MKKVLLGKADKPGLGRAGVCSIPGVDRAGVCTIAGVDRAGVCSIANLLSFFGLDLVEC